MAVNTVEDDYGRIPRLVTQHFDWLILDVGRLGKGQRVDHASVIGMALFNLFESFNSLVDVTV